jgi:hypothetical protein
MMKKLNEINEKNPFKVPENYFEVVNRRILSETTGYIHEVKKPGLFFRFRTQFAIAASVAGFILLSYTAIKLLTAEEKSLKLSDAASEEYSVSYIDDIDLITLEENAASLDLPEVEPEVSNNEIIDYLLLENIEISEIYEKL